MQLNLLTLVVKTTVAYE